MRATLLRVHNFRSLQDVEIHLCPFSLLIGANNVGKSNVIDAIRVFYDHLKFDPKRDFPKFKTEDEETWIEIEYQLSDSEWARLADKYRRAPEKKIRIRRYLQSKDKRLGLYFVESGDRVAEELFYGARNVQKAKLGKIVYIPAVSRLDEQTKLTGPSPLKELISMVLEGVLSQSPSYSQLEEAFYRFEQAVKKEKSKDGYSLKKLEREISDEIKSWGVDFLIGISPISPSEVVKNLIRYEVKDGNLGTGLDPRLYGQGFQRHLIFTLIKLAAERKASPGNESREVFSGNLTWLLYEEPEAFLHPSQIEVLNKSLKDLSLQKGYQVLISSHNPIFVSRNIDNLTSLVRLHRDGPHTIVKQIDEDRLNSILNANIDMTADWSISSPSAEWEKSQQIELESIKYALWLDARRCNAFFADIVLLVEGPSEVALFEYLIAKGQIKVPKGKVVVFDSMGKFNLHRFMNLFEGLGIRHSVLYDRDQDANGQPKYPKVDETIHEAQNETTIKIDFFPKNIEEFLGIPPAPRPHQKPQHIMWHVRNGQVAREKLQALINKVETLLQG